MWWKATGEGIELTVRAQPRASRSEVAGVFGEALKVRIAAPPVDGAANEALIRFLAKVLGVPRRRIRITRGEHGRTKVLHIRGLDGMTAERKLGG